MGIRYNKDYTPRNKRLNTAGPRDRQLKQEPSIAQSIDTELVEALKNQIVSLQEQLAKSSTKGYTDEQVNNMLAKVVKEETKKLNDEITSLKEIIKNKDELITTLKSQTADYNKLTVLLTEATKKLNSGVVIPDEPIVESDRPAMEEVFVDPSTSNEKLESHIGVETVKGTEKKQMDDKVNKLKNLLGGGLPKKG